jgi:hypothetical protein
MKGDERMAPESESQVTGKYVGYLLLFVVLFFVLYIFPEILIFKQHGFAPVEHIVDTGTNPTLGEILAGMWRDRGQLLNPMNNALVRFFLVTIIIGVVFDQVKKHAPRDVP